MRPSENGHENALEGRFSRLTATAAFRGPGFAAWRAARIAVVGAGRLGRLLCQQLVQLGGRVLVIDPDHTEPANLATQGGRVGQPKVDSLVEQCDALEPGRAEGLRRDVLAVGPGRLAGSAVLVDATDAPGLGLPLTRLANGLAIPLVRVAVDETGEDMGRVLVSHAADGGACQICRSSAADLARRRGRTPCPGAPHAEAAPSLAGAAIVPGIVGVALLQIQRLVTGNDREQALDHEHVFDLAHGAYYPLRLTRSDTCLSGHERWTTRRLGTASTTTVADALRAARAAHGEPDVVLEPLFHPLALAATCTACEAPRQAVGAARASAPPCPACGGPSRWVTEVLRARLDAAAIESLGLARHTLADLGLPTDGALLLTRATARAHPVIALQLEPES